MTDRSDRSWIDAPTPAPDPLSRPPAAPIVKRPGPEPVLEVDRMRALQRLRDLLVEAEPLVSLLDSVATVPELRQALRQMVGPDRYQAVVGGLLRMSSDELWEAEHVGDFISPETARQLRVLGVRVLPHTIRRRRR